MIDIFEAVSTETEPKIKGAYLEDLLPAFRRLDHLLEQAIIAAQIAYGPEAAADRYRGLYISQNEVERLLAREPLVPLFRTDEDGPGEPSPTPRSEDASRLSRLQRAFSLSQFDLDLILIALAPELDRRYERLYAYLQDHVSRRRPGVDLCLNLLCSDAAERLEKRTHFDPDAPLIRCGLIHLVREPDHPQPSLLAHTLKLDEQITRFLMYQDSLDSRLATFCQLISSTDSLDKLPLKVENSQKVAALLSQARSDRQPLRLYFHGPHGVGKRQSAAALAAAAGLPLLLVDLAQALTGNSDFRQAMQLVFSYARFYQAIPYLEGLDRLSNEGQAGAYQQQLLDILSQDRGVTILAGTKAQIPPSRHPLGLLCVPFTLPDFARRRACWQADLTEAGLTLAASELDTLAGRFRLTPAQIAEAVAIGRHLSPWSGAGESIYHHLLAAARTRTGHHLAELARKIEPLYTWADIVLPDDTLEQLREICQRVALRHRVLNEWAFAAKLSLGKGVNALFAGPSGTGKTMAAEIIANELGLDLYKIDLSGVVSKYIGETEKNLDRIFSAAEDANAILFFDEADALFGKRSEVRDSHDRYANIEISYLLQKMEEYDGLAILATNLRQNLDEAFIRRLAFTIHFPFPDEISRERIWAGIWPAATPLAGDVDLPGLARQFKLSGGNIKNVALAAAFLAAEDGGQVTTSHLIQAIRREYQKMGKVLAATDLNGSGGNRHG